MNLSYLICLLFLLILSLWDIKKLCIPNFVLLMFLISTLFSHFFLLKNPFIKTFLNTVFFTFLFHVISVLSKGLGAGDVKVFGILAIPLSFLQTCVLGIISCIFGIFLFCITTIFFKKKTNHIPFIPCLTVGFIGLQFIGGSF